LRTTINKNAQTTLSSIRHMIRKNKYSPNLRMAAIHRDTTEDRDGEEEVHLSHQELLSPTPQKQ
ncbi:60S ribosomal protein L28, partial [Cricetulus griseus]